jgi:hypothetical protein
MLEKVRWLSAALDTAACISALVIAAGTDWKADKVSESCQESGGHVFIILYALSQLFVAIWTTVRLALGAEEAATRLDQFHVLASFGILVWASVIIHRCNSSMIGSEAFGLVVFALMHALAKGMLGSCALKMGVA